MLRIKSVTSCSFLPLRMLSLALALTLPLSAAAKDKEPADSAKVVFTDSSAAGLAGTKRVAITNVLISFQASVSSRTAIGGMFGDKSDTSTALVMADMDTALLTEITDAIYAQLQLDLQASGFEVVPEEAVLASPTYQKIAKLAGFTNFSKYGNIEGAVMLVEASKLTPYAPFSPEVGTFPYPMNNMIKDWNSDKTGGLTSNSTYYSADLPKLEVALAKELNAHVVKASYIVTLGSTKSDAGSGAHNSNTYAGEVIAQVGIRDTHSRIAFRAPNGKTGGQSTSRAKPVPPKDGDVVIRLAQPIFGSKDLFSLTSFKEGKGIWGLGGGADMKFTFVATIKDSKTYQDEVVGMLKVAQKDLLTLVQQ